MTFESTIIPVIAAAYIAYKYFTGDKKQKQGIISLFVMTLFFALLMLGVWASVAFAFIAG